MIKLPDSTYQIIRMIGHGGTGTVFLAYHSRLEKYVVLKQLQGVNDTSELRTEVDILKSLHHPHLPQVYDFISDGTNVYTVMDYIEGYELAEIIDSGMPCSTDDVIRWFRQLTDVLIYLHEQDLPVIHSDIKPANIIINSRNEAVLIDFNIAVYYNTDTVRGMSLDYASPEQITLMQNRRAGIWSGEMLDGRSDIYSLCATFCYLLSGQRPSFFYGHAPLTEQSTGYPEVFCEIVERGMRPEPEYRFQSAREMRAALDRMWRRSAAYKTYVALQLLLIIITAALVGFGGYKVVTGLQNDMHADLISECNRCIQLANGSDPEEAAMRCIDTLNKNSDALAKEKELKGRLLAGVAVSSYKLGNYEEAAEYYLDAAECFSEDEDMLLDMYNGAALSYVSDDDLGSAEYTITKAETKGISDDGIILIRAAIESIKQDYDACLSEVKELENSGADNEILARAYLTLADCCPEEERYQWLMKAYDCGAEDETVLRKLGYELIDVVMPVEEHPDNAEHALTCAAVCLKKVCESDTAGANDHLSLSTAYRLLGNYDMALKVLDDLERDLNKNSKIPDSDESIKYVSEQINLFRAIIFDQRGNSIRAEEALRIAKPLMEDDKTDAGIKEVLGELIEKYGV